MFELIESIRAIAPPLVDTIGSLAALATALQLALSGIGKFWPKAATAAHWLGIVAIDLRQATDGVKKLTGKSADTTPASVTHITIPPKGDS